MKKTFNFVALLLVMVFTFYAVSCGNNKSNINPDQGQHEEPNGGDSENQDKDKHYIISNEYIVQNGSTQYQIVIPETTSNTISFAANELETFFAKATDIHLITTNDAGLSYSDSSKYFSIGKTSLAEQAGVKIAEDLGHSGAQIETVGNCVFMIGETDLGSLYAVYDLLEEMFGFEYFGNECYTLSTGLKEVKRLDFKGYKDIPSVQRRMSTSGINTYNITERYRFRQEDYYSSTFAMINAVPWHNCFEYIKDDVAGHEWAWYSNDQTQLCYTAHGDSGEYELMLEACLKSLKNMVIDYPEKNAATFTDADTRACCGCSACAANLNKYKVPSASYVLFMNDLRAKLEAWFNTEEGAPHKRDFTIFFFAYFATTDAPAEYNESTGKWQGINGIHCADGVGVLYAPIDNDYMRSIYSEQNKQYLNAFHGWQAVSDTIYCWTYDWDFRSYFAPYDTFDTLSDLYKCIVEHGVEYIFQEGGHYQKEGASCWEMLKMYLNSKLSWNYKENVNELIDKFFANFYGPVADDMRDIFDSFRMRSAYLKANFADYGGMESCQKSLNDTRWWPKQLLLSWNTKFDKIFEKLNTIKNSDPTYYNQLYKRVCIEHLSPIYLLISLYGSELDSELIGTLRAEFKSYIELWGITKGDLGDPIKDTYATLGIK